MVEQIFTYYNGVILSAGWATIVIVASINFKFLSILARNLKKVGLVLSRNEMVPIEKYREIKTALFFSYIMYITLMSILSWAGLFVMAYRGIKSLVLSHQEEKHMNPGKLVMINMLRRIDLPEDIVKDALEKLTFLSRQETQQENPQDNNIILEM